MRIEAKCREDVRRIVIREAAKALRVSEGEVDDNTDLSLVWIDHWLSTTLVAAIGKSIRLSLDIECTVGQVVAKFEQKF